jgi:hypothetical protein
VAVSAAQVADRVSSQVMLSGQADGRRRSDIRSGSLLILGSIPLLLASFVAREIYQAGVTFECMQIASAVLSAAGLFVFTRQRERLAHVWYLRALVMLLRAAALISIGLILLRIIKVSPLTSEEQALRFMRVELMVNVFSVAAFFLYGSCIAWSARRRRVSVLAAAVAISAGVVGLSDAEWWLAPPFDSRTSLASGRLSRTIYEEFTSSERGQRTAYFPPPPENAFGAIASPVRHGLAWASLWLLVEFAWLRPIGMKRAPTVSKS